MVFIIPEVIPEEREEDVHYIRGGWVRWFIILEEIGDLTCTRVFGTVRACRFESWHQHIRVVIEQRVFDLRENRLYELQPIAIAVFWTNKHS